MHPLMFMPPRKIEQPSQASQIVLNGPVISARPDANVHARVNAPTQAAASASRSSAGTNDAAGLAKASSATSAPTKPVVGRYAIR